MKAMKEAGAPTLTLPLPQGGGKTHSSIQAYLGL